jgi:hypothetical protein
MINKKSAYKRCVLRFLQEVEFLEYLKKFLIKIICFVILIILPPFKLGISLLKNTPFQIKCSRTWNRREVNFNGVVFFWSDHNCMKRISNRSILNGVYVTWWSKINSVTIRYNTYFNELFKKGWKTIYI